MTTGPSRRSFAEPGSGSQRCSLSSHEFGCQSMAGPLRRVLVKRPDEAFAIDDPARWHYASRPDLQEARREHDALVEILTDAGSEVIDHPEPQPDRADAIFVFDPALVTDRGVVILRMGKELRRGEEAAMARRFREIGVPILAELGARRPRKAATCSGSTRGPS